MPVNISNRHNAPDCPTVENLELVQPRTNNIISIVVAKKTNNNQPRETLSQSRLNLIALTEKLAEEAKSGALKGLGGFAEYENDYILGLEGSYLLNPESALAPLTLLERRVVDQILEHES